MNKIIELIGKGGDMVMGLIHKIPEDKRGHLTLGLLFGVVLGYHVTVAVITVLAIAVGKEVYDYLSNKLVGGSHEVSVMDALCTIIGGGIGIGLCQLIGA